MSRRSWWFVLVPSFGNSQAYSFRAPPAAMPNLLSLCSVSVIGAGGGRMAGWFTRHALLVEG